jgi:hypothetical protein
MDSLLVQLALANTAQKVTGVSTPYKTASFFGYKSFSAGVPQNNSATVYLGFKSGELPIAVPTGQRVEWNLLSTQGDNLNNFWVQGASGDSVYIISYF